MKEKILNPYKDIPVATLNEESNTRYGSDYLSDVRSLQVGYGSKVLRVDRQGIWLGSADFASAPFSVDMDGNVVATSLTLSSLSGTLDDISDGISYAKTTLTEVLGASYGYAGLNNSGEIIKGFLNSQLSTKTLPTNGVRIDSSGIYGRKAGSTTFYIDSAGSAYFTGNIVASSFTGGTITGATLQTASSGQRIIISGSTNSIAFYDSLNNNQGTMYGSSSNGIFITGNNFVSLAIGSSNYMFASGSSGVMALVKDMLPIGSSVRLGDYGSNFVSVWTNNLVTSEIITNGGQISTTGGFYPSSGSLYDLGNSSFHWNKIWTNSIDGGTITGSSLSVGSGYIRGGGYHYLNSGDNNAYVYSNGTNVLIRSSAGGVLTIDGTSKTAIVPTSKGFNALYSVESPEVWFMDFIKKDKIMDPLFLETTVAPYKFIKCEGGGYQVWGKRKGHEKTRFEKKTFKEFQANEKFLNINKVG